MTRRWLLLALAMGAALTAPARPRQHPVRGRLRQPPPPPPVIHWRGGTAYRPPWFGWEVYTRPWGGGSAFVSPAGGVVAFGAVPPAPRARPAPVRPAARKALPLPIAIRGAPKQEQGARRDEAPGRVWVKGHWRYARDGAGNIVSRTWVPGHWREDGDEDSAQE